MKTLAYETTNGTLKVLRGEWDESGAEPVFKAEDGKRVYIEGTSKLVVLVATPKGGRTTRLLGYIA